jgi:hypothetical protein
MAIASLWDADSLPNGGRSRTNSPTQYELSEVCRRRNSWRFRFSRLSAIQVHGTPQEINLTH